MKDVYMGKNWDMEKRSNKHSYIFEIFFIIISQFSHSVMFNSLWPHGLQHARLPCPSPTLEACSNSCPSSQWCHPTISSSVIPFSSSLQSSPASGSFSSQFFGHTPQTPAPSCCTFQGPSSLSGVCMAAARTVWFSFHLGFHRSAVPLSALNVSPLTQTIAPLWGSDLCFSSPTHQGQVQSY